MYFYSLYNQQFRLLQGGGEPPVNTIAPVVSGSGVVGQTLTTTNGTWSGTLPITYTYQWLRNSLPISGATSQTYLLVYADRGANVICVVTATNVDGSASANSNTIAVAAFDADYQAILDKASSPGFGYTLPSDSVKVKQNTLLTSMKADGVWAKLDVFYVFAQDGGSAFGTLNWKNPNANQSTLVNSPTFVSNGGLQGNGTSSYIDTNFNPATQGVNYTLNNASMYFFPHAMGTSGTSMTGTSGAENRIQLGVSLNQRINAGGTALSTSFNYTSIINPKSIHRTSATNMTLYNGSVSDTRTLASINVPNANLFVLRSSTNYGNHTCAAFAAGSQLTAENTNFVNDWNTYKSSL